LAASEKLYSTLRQAKSTVSGFLLPAKDDLFPFTAWQKFPTTHEFTELGLVVLAQNQSAHKNLADIALKITSFATTDHLHLSAMI
jgi:hypothetical protein